MVWKNRVCFGLFYLLHGFKQPDRGGNVVAVGRFRGGKPSRTLILLALIGLMLPPLEARADRTIDSVTLDGAASVTVIPSATISAAVNVTTTGSGSSQPTRWYSTGWSIGSTPPAPSVGADNCVNHANYSTAGTYSETLSITAPVPAGTYNVYFFAYENDACTASPSPVFTMANAVTVTTNPVPAISDILPTSKNKNSAGFTLTVNGINFVPASVVRFNGSDRTTSYVSSTKLTATIPATDLTTLGTFNITVHNPSPDGGDSIAHPFIVTPQPPTAATGAATGVTSWVATLNGTVSSNEGATTVSFQYGLTAAYGSAIDATPSSLGASDVNAAVSAEVIGLNCGSTFHYRVVATNSGGTTYGLDQTLTTGACTPPFPENACPATRYGSDLGCNANDVNLSGITLATTNNTRSCVSGTSVILDLDITVNFSQPSRWDVGIFIAKDGKLPSLLPTNGGAASCSVDVLSNATPFMDLDGGATGDTCGDGQNSISGIHRMTSVTLPCYASPDSAGQLYVPYVVSWDNQASPVGSLCTSNLYPVPNTSSKCNAPASSVSLPVVVLPVITKTDGVTVLNPGANTVYTVTIINNTGGTLLDSVFTDPAVEHLTVNSVSCSAASGAVCPAVSVAAMQGAGIAIPSANLPNNSSLTFTINATLSETAPVTAEPTTKLVNTATVTIGSNSTSATDEDEIVIAPSVGKTFSPGMISTGSASQLTITLVNPDTSPITGVSFTDTYPAGLVNTANANSTTNCGGMVTAFNNSSSLALSGGSIPALSSCTVTVNVTSASVGSYFNTTGAITTNSGAIAAASATLIVSAPVYGAFNACDVGTVCTATTTVTNSHITTKVAGVAFNLALVELSANGNYNKAVKVELLNSNDNSGTLDANNCRSSWTVIQTLAVNPTFANSKVTAGSFTVNEAYRDVRVRITSTSGTAMTGCSTDNFAIRPNELAISPTDNDWATAGLGRILNNTDASTVTPVHKTGSPFTVTATAKNAIGATTANYAGIPTSVLSACGGTACPVLASLGVYTPSLSLVSSGVRTWTANYSEVGAFGLTLQDIDFTSVDAADSAATCAGRYVCSADTPVGRFVPDHFDVEGSNGAMASACSNSFTYAGQPMGYGTAPTLTIKPMNAATGGGVTQNYQGALDKLKNPTINELRGGATISITPPAADGSQNGADGTTKTELTASMQPGALTNSAGTLTYTLGSDQYTYTRNDNAKINAYTSGIRLVVSTVEDTDGVSSVTDNSASPAAGTLPRTLNPAGVPIRYGRVKIADANGPETENLTIPVMAEYWDGASWITNDSDSCTSFAANSITMGNYLSSDLIACETHISPAGPFTLSSGTLNPELTLTAPGANNKGSVDLSLNTGSVASGLTCTSAIETSAAGANIPWFEVKSGRAIFGRGSSSNRFIYIRELY